MNYTKTTEEQIKKEISPTLATYAPEALRGDLPPGAVYDDHFVIERIAGEVFIMPGIRNERKNRYTLVSEEEAAAFKAIFTGTEYTQEEISEKILENMEDFL